MLQGVSSSVSLSQVACCRIGTHQIVQACQCYTQCCEQKHNNKTKKPETIVPIRASGMAASPVFHGGLKIEAAFLSTTTSQL